jgi:outer membrane protein assembly factor BamB
MKKRDGLTRAYDLSGLSWPICTVSRTPVHQLAESYRQNSVSTTIETQIENIVSNGVLYTSSTNYEIDAISTTDGSVLWHYTVGGIAYVSIGSALYALNASNGSFLWKSSIKGILCAVSVKLGIVYLVDSVTNNPVVHALSLQTGQQLWTH